MKYYHILRAKLRGWRYVLRNLPAIFGENDEFSAKTMRILLYRLGQSKYWDNVAVEQPCGCRGYKGHFISYLMDCPEHGINTLFEWEDKSNLPPAEESRAFFKRLNRRASTLAKDDDDT